VEPCSNLTKTAVETGAPKLSLEKLVFAVYASLTTSERRIADVILSRQSDLASYTATELAARAGVSKATAARLFKLLGYQTYEEAREESRAIRNWGAPLPGAPANDIASGGPPADIHLAVEIENLRSTFQRSNHETVTKVTSVLAHAPRVWVAGLRAPSPSLSSRASFFRCSSKMSGSSPQAA